MARKTPKKRRHIPQRTCIGCRTVQPKRSMIRLVRNAEGVQIDLTGKLAGRGAYLHNLQSCWETGLQGSLDRALKTQISADDRERLLEFIKSLPGENGNTQET